MTGDSTAEQGGAGLNALSREEMARIADLNRRYREKFGFPFIIAVRQNTKDGIFREFERRLAHDRDTELADLPRAGVRDHAPAARRTDLQ